MAATASTQQPLSLTPNSNSNTRPGRLEGRIAIITGSSGGLGRAIATLFASEGAKCFCVDKYANPRNPINKETGKADDWENRIGNDENANKQQEEEKDPNTIPTHLYLQSLHGADSAKFHAADLTIETAVESMIETCLQAYSRIDILINAHGISLESTQPVPLRCHDLPLSSFQLTQTINTTSLFLTCKHVLGQFLKQDRLYEGARGWIVNIASIQGLVPYYCCAAYGASKGAAIMLSKQIALDYAADGVVCNAVCPGYLRTDMTRNLRVEGGPGGEGGRYVAGRQVLRSMTGTKNEAENELDGGFGKVEDVARVVLVMAGDDVRWMTGQPVVVDGGFTIS